MKIEVRKFDGGRSVLLGAGTVGVLGLLIALAGVGVDPVPALHSYLLAFVYWGGIALASVVLLQIFHATRARWMVVLRRALELMASSVSIFVLLFIPIAVGMKHLYPWVDPPKGLSDHALHLLEHKRPYLNVTFFLVRSFFYLLLATLIANRLLRWSVAQDTSGDVNLTARQRRFGVGALPFIALAFSFAGFDWLMSLEPLWFSTIFGVYFFAGSFLSTISLLVVITDRARGKNLYGNLVTPEHVHNLGKLMLAFTCFWAYIAFSQFMLIWIANLPEEVPFFIVRMKGAWGAVGASLIVIHFLIPFACLLSRSLKRNRSSLAAVAFWILLVHAVDLYWLIMPALSPDRLVFHWSLIPAFVGVGGIAVAFGVWRARGHFTVPVRDPYLGDSLAYRQP